MSQPVTQSVGAISLPNTQHACKPSVDCMVLWNINKVLADYGVIFLLRSLIKCILIHSCLSLPKDTGDI